MDLRPAIILFAHGARDPRWSEPFEAVAAELRTLRPQADVRLAYLEFMSPGLLQAAAQAVQAGARSVSVVPLFLGAGGHVRKDVPLLLEQLRQTHPDVRFDLQPAIGERASVIHAMATAAAEPVQGPPG